MNNIDIKTTIKMLETMAQTGIYMQTLNELLVDKGIYTDKEFDSYWKKIEEESEELTQLRQVIAFLKMYAD